MIPQPARSTTRPALFTALGILAILLWSTTVAFSRTLSEQLGPFTTGASVYLLAGVSSCLLTLLRPGGRRRFLRMLHLPRRYLLGCGALFVVYVLLLYPAIGMAHNRPQVLAVGLANYMWPSLTLLLALPIHHQKAGWQMPVGIALGLGASWLALVGDQSAAVAGLLADPSALLPVGLALLAALLWGLYSNLTRLWGPQDEDVSGVPLFLLASGALFVPLRFAAGEPAPHWLAVLPSLVYMAVFATCLGYLLWDSAMQNGDFLLVASLSYFTPLLSSLVSLLVLGVPLTPQLGIAALMVTGGALLARRGVRSS